MAPGPQLAGHAERPSDAWRQIRRLQREQGAEPSRLRIRAVLGLGVHDLEFAHGVAGLAPSGDGVKDDFYRGRSHLSEVHEASRLSFNSIRLGLEEIFCFLQLPDQLFDFRNRCSSSLPNKWRDIRVNFGLGRRRRLDVNEIAVFAFGFHNTQSFPS